MIRNLKVINVILAQCLMALGFILSFAMPQPMQIIAHVFLLVMMAIILSVSQSSHDDAAVKKRNGVVALFLFALCAIILAFSTSFNAYLRDINHSSKSSILNLDEKFISLSINISSDGKAVFNGKEYLDTEIEILVADLKSYTPHEVIIISNDISQAIDWLSNKPSLKQSFPNNILIKEK